MINSPHPFFKALASTKCAQTFMLEFTETQFSIPLSVEFIIDFEGHVIMDGRGLALP